MNRMNFIDVGSVPLLLHSSGFVFVVWREILNLLLLNLIIIELFIIMELLILISLSDFPPLLEWNPFYST